MVVSGSSVGSRVLSEGIAKDDGEYDDPSASGGVIECMDIPFLLGSFYGYGSDSKIWRALSWSMQRGSFSSIYYKGLIYFYMVGEELLVTWFHVGSMVGASPFYFCQTFLSCDGGPFYPKDYVFWPLFPMGCGFNGLDLDCALFQA